MVQKNTDQDDDKTIPMSEEIESNGKYVLTSIKTDGKVPTNSYNASDSQTPKNSLKGTT